MSATAVIPSRDLRQSRGDRGAGHRLDLKLELVREGGKHTIYRCGSQLVTVPRHREINEMTAIGIMADLEAELGKGWWKK